MSLPKGFLLSGIHCGIKRKKLDLGLIYAPDFLKATGFFTTNVNPAYSVTLCKKSIHNPVRAVLVNSGNANCYSHRRGLDDTAEIIGQLAGHLGVKPKNVLIASTGIIGKRLPRDKIIRSFPELTRRLGRRVKDFAQSILTTDTVAKTAFTQLKVKGVGIAGFA